MKTIVCVCVFSCLAVLIDCTSVLSLLRKRQAQGCGQREIYEATERCYGRLLALTEVPASTDAELLQDVEAMCSNVKTSGDCFNTAMQRCGQAGMTMAHMMRNVFEFVCGEGQSGSDMHCVGFHKTISVTRCLLVSEGACWAHETLREDIGQCTKAMETGFSTQGFNAWCSLTNDYIKCLGREIREKTVCSHAASLFIQEMFRRSVQPAADVMRCHLHARATRDLVNLLLRR